jgi:hypothetical protein
MKEDNMTEGFRFALGEFVKDKVTGWAGTIMTRTEYYVSEERTYAVSPVTLPPDGTLPKWEWFDEKRLILVTAKAE